jgi:hypothetical protein
MILINMLIMNLTVAAVIEGLSSAQDQNNGTVSTEEISKLLEIWSEYDPKAKGYIRREDLIFFYMELPHPF